MKKLAFIFVLLIPFSGCRETKKPDFPGNSKIATPDIEKAFISFRIGVPQWDSDSRFNELLELFDRHRGVTDEIPFSPPQLTPLYP